MRKALNALYQASTVLAACCLAAIAGLVVLQVLGRLIDGALRWLGHEPFGLLVPSLAEIAGFLLVGASFLALAGTFRNADHIRVSILLQSAPGAVARLLNVWALIVTSGLALFFTWHAGWLAFDSFVYNEVSFGIIPIPLVLPQAVMAAGLAVFALALLDDLLLALTGHEPSFEIAGRRTGADDVIEGKE